jgi:hypothetical protein
MGRKIVRDVSDIKIGGDSLGYSEKAPRYLHQNTEEVAAETRLRGNQMGQAITDAILAGGLVKGDKKRGGK